MIAERIKRMREQNGMTQAELARKLSITRSSVNSWEMGLSVPSTQSVVDLANLFRISTDFLLGVDATSNMSVDGLTSEDVQMVYGIVSHIRELREKEHSYD